MTKYCGDYEYRFIAVRGLERRRITERYWQNVTGTELEAMSWEELEHCAHLMRDAAKEDRP